MDRTHVRFIQIWPQFLLSTCIEAFFSSMQALNLSFNIICRSALPLVLKHHVRSEYKILPARNVKGYLKQKSWVVILRQQLGGDVYKNSFFARGIFQSRRTHYHYIYKLPRQPCLIYWLTVKFVKGAILLHGIVANELTVKEVKFKEDAYILNRKILAKLKSACYPDTLVKWPSWESTCPTSCSTCAYSISDKKTCGYTRIVTNVKESRICRESPFMAPVYAVTL